MVDIITFEKLREYDACSDRYKYLAEKCEVLDGKRREFRGTSVTKDAQTTLLDILDHNGLDDTLWALRCIGDDDRRKWLVCTISHAFAKHVLHFFEDKFPKDKRLRKALEAILLYRDGKVSKAELDAAWAAGDAAWTARDAAWTAWDAAWAAGDAGAAWDAAWAAARAAARDAARDAAWAARDAAWTAAGDAERKWQAEKLKQILSTTGT